jgi:WD repeat-containing protein 35
MKDTIDIFLFYLKRLRVLKIPGNQVSALSWEGKSLRIAVAVDSFIYFANIRPNYMYCYLGKTVVFYENQQKQDEYQVKFWDTVTNKCYQKIIEAPLGMSAFENNCVIATEINTLLNKDASNILETNGEGLVYQLQVCNAIGTTIDCKLLML